MEKSSLNAATTRTIPASNTAAKVAIPARRGGSPRRGHAASFPHNAKKTARKEKAPRSRGRSKARPRNEHSPEAPGALLATRYLLRLLQRKAPLAPIANSAIHRYDIGVSHFLQVVGGQRGTEAAATIEYERSFEIGILALNVALDDALAQVDGSGQVVGVEFAVFADVYENELLTAIEPRLDFVNVGFAYALLGVVDNLQKARWMLMRHGRRLPTGRIRITPKNDSRRLGCELPAASFEQARCPAACGSQLEAYPAAPKTNDSR